MRDRVGHRRNGRFPGHVPQSDSNTERGWFPAGVRAGGPLSPFRGRFGTRGFSRPERAGTGRGRRRDGCVRRGSKSDPQRRHPLGESTREEHRAPALAGETATQREERGSPADGGPDQRPVHKPERGADEAEPRSDTIEARRGQAEEIPCLKCPGGESADESSPRPEDAGSDRRGVAVLRELTTERYPRDHGDDGTEPSQDRNLLKIANQDKADGAEDEEPEETHRHEASGA